MKQKDLVLLSALGGIVLVLLAVLAWFLTPPSQVQQAEVTGKPAQQTKAAAAAKTVNDNEPGLAAAVSPSPAARAAEMQVVNRPPQSVTSEVSYSPEEERIGIKKKVLSQGDQGRVLHFSVTSEKRCMMGDIDIIKKDLEHSSKPKLLLTLESLDPGDTNFPPVVNEVSLDSLTGGYDVSFVVPDGADTYHLGLFVCSDSLGQNRCFVKDKQVEDLNNVLNQYMMLEQKQKYQKDRNLPVDRETVEAEDRIYFFNYLLINGNQLSVLDSSAAKPAYESLKKYLAAAGESAGVVLDVPVQVERLNTALRSMPVAVDGLDMKLNFPVFDIYECGAAKKALQKIKEVKQSAQKGQ
jgi:hypothetical protein